MHDFSWEDGTFEELTKLYPRNISSLKWWCNYSEKKYSYYNINRTANLKEYMMQHNPPIRISAVCCEKAKKAPSRKFEKKGGFDLICLGVRKYEGGIRSVVYNSCYDDTKIGEAHKFFPIFWFSDEDKEEYRRFFNIKRSDCYDVWGMKRTGCAGCPFNSNIQEELSFIKEYEPRMYDAIINVFGQGYSYRRGYGEFREVHKKKNLK